MEKAAKTALCQLKEVCLRNIDLERRGDQYRDDITTMVTVSIMALQHRTDEEVHSVSNVTGTSQLSIRALLEVAALEGLQELATQEIRSSDTQQTSPYSVRVVADDFWSHCHSLTQFSLKNPVQLAPLKQAISSLHRFSLGVSRLLVAFLSVGKAVLNQHQILAFLSHLHNNFWSQEARKLAEQITLIKIESYVENSSVESDNSIAMLAMLMATLYSLFCIHDTVETSLLVDQQNPEGAKSLSIQQDQAISLWLCRSELNPILDSLTTSAPKLLLSVYQSTMERDKEILHKGAEMGEVPKHIMAVSLLTSALQCMSKLCQEVTHSSPSPSSGKTVRGPLISSMTMETSLRLANHCWDVLYQITKEVPSELPASVLCLILASFIKLHSYLLHNSLPFTNEQKEAHSFLLHALSESCEGLVERIISYHSQLCLTNLLHDASSQDWSNTKPFFEGERESYTIQMWCYHMHGLRHDLCTLLAPTSHKVAEKILLGVLSTSLSHLTRRYSTTTPSHARLNQFRADILSIFSTVMSLQPQLRHQNKADISNRNSPEIILIHRSCNQLLNVLAIGACPLADLEKVLGQHSPLPTKSVGVEEKTSEDERWENVLIRESMKECSCQWVSALERHQVLLTTTQTKSATAAGGEGTSLYGHESGAAAEVVVSMSCFPFVSKSGVCMTPMKQGQLDTRILLTQPNIAPSLLQALLSNATSLAVSLCLSDIATDSLIVDLASLLSLCCHDEWALSDFYSKLKRAEARNSSRLQDRNSIKEEVVHNWLSRRLQIEVERYVLSMATGFHGNLHDKDDVSKRDGCSDGASLAKIVAFLVSRWPIFAHLRLPDRPLGASEPDSTHNIRLSDSAHHLRLPDGPLGESMSSHLSSVVCVLAGLKLSQGTPHIIQEVINSHQRELQSWLDQFNNFLPRAGTRGGCGQREEPTPAECEAMWEVISEDDVIVMSLERIHNALVQWSRLSGEKIDSSGGFNPQGEYSNVPTMEMIDSIDWKGLVGGVIAGGATTPTVCSLLETVRWEFQDGASSYMEEREAELSKAVRRHLHYKDDCTV